MRHAVDDLQHDLPARRLADAPVHDRAGIEADDVHPCQPGLHLVDRGELREHPGSQLQIDDRAAVPCGVVSLVAAVLREEEEPGREPRLVDPLGDELLLHDGEPHDAMSGREGHAVGLTARNEGAQLLPARNDDVFALKGAVGPFDGARLHVAAVAGRQGDPGAGECRRDAAAERGRHPDEKMFFHVR